MTDRPRIVYDPTTPDADRVRLWLLQSGADPVTASEPDAADLPSAPQHAGVRREEVQAVVRALRGRPPRDDDRFDDHGSAHAWPRGSF